MDKLKSIWTTLTGSISSIIPMFFACCKTGACTAVCVSPFASLLGVSSASIASSPLMKPFYSLLIIISSISFTTSYFKLYVLPKYNTKGCATDCNCTPIKPSFQERFSLYSFWIGLVVSIVFFTYFEYQNYQTSVAAQYDSELPCCSDGEGCSE